MAVLRGEKGNIYLVPGLVPPEEQGWLFAPMGEGLEAEELAQDVGLEGGALHRVGEDGGGLPATEEASAPQRR